MTSLEILEAHEFAVDTDYETAICTCGNWKYSDCVGQVEAHQLHVAGVLDRHVREWCYEAWREGVAVFDPDAVDIMEAINPYK